MMQARLRTWAILLALVLSGPALAGAPDASLAGATRGTLDIVLPYYPPSARALGLGRATVALEGVDSHNPAALGFFKGIDLSASYGNLDFRRGPDLDIYNTSVVIPTPMLGGSTKLMGFYLHTRDRDPSKMMGANTELWGQQIGIASGVQVPIPDGFGKLALGFAGFPNDPSEVTLTMPDGMGGKTRVAHGRGQSVIGSIRLGALYKPTDEASIGAEFTHIKDKLHASYLGIPGRFESNYHVNLLTIGAAYRVLKSTILMVQYTTGAAHGQGVDAHYAIDSGGVEHQIKVAKDVTISLRGGWYDNGPTCGVGTTLPGQCRVDYGYMHDYGEGAKKAFGHGPLHLFTFGKTF